jgi:uncharacterized RDD family membrane protein YckC
VSARWRGAEIDQLQGEYRSMARYAGFWIRFVASLIDSVLLLIIILPLLIAVYGWEYFESTELVQGPFDFLVGWVFPAVAVIVFWIYRAATPGKMAVGARIVDARTGEKPSTGQLIGRYFAYFVSLLPLLFGFLWAAFDARKQAWHDKLAGTVVVRDTEPRSGTAEFDRQRASSSV